MARETYKSVKMHKKAWQLAKIITAHTDETLVDLLFRLVEREAQRLNISLEDHRRRA